MHKKLYYMHPINTYNTPLEQTHLRLIEQLFPHWEIVNPNTPHHIEGYANSLLKNAGPLDYFIALASTCYTGVALPFRDGMIGSGVYAEITTLRTLHRPVWILTHDNMLHSWNDEHDAHKILTLEETRHRIRYPDGSLKPY